MQLLVKGSAFLLNVLSYEGIKEMELKNHRTVSYIQEIVEEFRLKVEQMNISLK